MKALSLSMQIGRLHDFSRAAEKTMLLEGMGFSHAFSRQHEAAQPPRGAKLLVFPLVLIALDEKPRNRKRWEPIATILFNQDGADPVQSIHAADGLAGRHKVVSDQET